RLEPVELRQHHIEHDRVVLVRLRHPQRVFAGARDIRRQALAREAAADEIGHTRLVFDDQHTHAADLTRRNGSRDAPYPLTLTSFAYSFPPVSACSDTMPIPGAYTFWSYAPGSRRVASSDVSAFLNVPAGTVTGPPRSTIHAVSSAWPVRNS